MSKPVLLFYCQHSLGMGHLIRSFSLAQTLSERFQVVFLNGGPVPAGVRLPDVVDIVDLPPLGMGADKQLLSRNSDYSVARAKALRRELIMTTFNGCRPDVILIELFPFGRKKFADELLPLLKAARRRPAGAPLILCSLRDLLVHNRRDQQRHDDRAGWLVERYFDAVLVHADPVFARLEESFRPRKPLLKPVHYTGFVLPAREAGTPIPRRRQVLVSAGGGIVGAPLFQAALEAQRLLWQSERLPMTLVAGPFLPQSDWQRLQRNCAGLPGLELHRSVPDLGSLMRQVTLSISQCGYNTSMDILYARVAALVVPFMDAGENEQIQRARRLEKLGLVHVLEPAGLSAATLVSGIPALVNTQPQCGALDLSGAATTARLIADMLERRQQNCSVAARRIAEPA
jgi:predicted glycosyltransferase